MSLRSTQSEFAALVPRLIDKAVALGFEVTLGDAYRDPRVPFGHVNSAHKKRLAIDLNLFRNGAYLEATGDHRELGEWWKQQHPLARWGGDFRDGNHYSFEWEGVK
jgi:hypothetical protein